MQRGIDSGEFLPVDVEYVMRLVIAPLWLLTVWRFSFDQCDSHKLDPVTYLDSHLDLILRGLGTATVTETGSRRKVAEQGAPVLKAVSETARNRARK